MNQKLTSYLILLVVAVMLASCNENVIGEYDVLEGSYEGIEQGAAGTIGSQIEVTIIKTFQTKFSFYLIFKGSTNVIEIPGVEFNTVENEFIYNKEDVDSDLSIRGSFLKNGLSGNISVIFTNSVLNFRIEKK